MGGWRIIRVRDVRRQGITGSTTCGWLVRQRRVGKGGYEPWCAHLRCGDGVYLGRMVKFFRERGEVTDPSRPGAAQAPGKEKYDNPQNDEYESSDHSTHYNSSVIAATARRHSCQSNLPCK